MYTTLGAEAGTRQRGIAADFSRDGQTGILIAGAGVPIDGPGGRLIISGRRTMGSRHADDGWDLD